MIDQTDVPVALQHVDARRRDSFVHVARPPHGRKQPIEVPRQEQRRHVEEMQVVANVEVLEDLEPANVRVPIDLLRTLEELVNVLRQCVRVNYLFF